MSSSSSSGAANFNNRQHIRVKYVGETDVCSKSKKVKIITAVLRNDVVALRKHLDSPELYKIKDAMGYPLLHLAILEKCDDVFDYLLSIEGYPLEEVDLKGDNALMVSLTKGTNCRNGSPCDYYSYELLRKGASSICCNGSYYCIKEEPMLQLAIVKSFFRVAKLLIEDGTDINEQNQCGDTALHVSLKMYPFSDDVVRMLLYYGADASIRNCSGYSAFDYVMMLQESRRLHRKDIEEIQQIFYYYMFDQYTECEISTQTLITIARNKSPLFHDIISHVTKVIMDDGWAECWSGLFQMDPEYLRILIEKYDYVIRAILTNFHDLRLKSFSLENVDRSVNFHRLSLEPFSIENMNILVESSLRYEMISIISDINSNLLIPQLIQRNGSESAVTETVCFLLSCGMEIYKKGVQTIFRKFGFCELVKIVLCMDIKEENIFISDAFLRIIWYVRTNTIEKVIANPRICSMRDLWHILDHCAHPHLKKFCYIVGDENLVAKARNLPNVPLLTELARNTFRRYFIKKNRIRTAKEFFTLIRLLPISTTHEKIITFETKLYHF